MTAILIKPTDPCLCGAIYSEHDLEHARKRFGRPDRPRCPEGKHWLRNRSVTHGIAKEYHFKRSFGVGLPGGGPWRIDMECTSRYHNSKRATESVENPCTCPRGMAISTGVVVKRRVTTIASYSKATTPGSTPALELAVCRKPEFAAVVDASFTMEETDGGAMKRQAMKELCSFCPEELKCRSWALAEESPAGAWGGVYGGLDVFDRRRVG